MVSSIIWDIPESERNKIRNRGQLSEHRGIARNPLFYLQDDWIHMEIGAENGRKTKKETRI